MKKVESSRDYGDIEAWREWAEAEYCQRCGGSGSVLRTEEVVEPRLSSAVFTLRVWRECDACNGTGRP